MERYDGQCVGGPWDGTMLAHWSKTKEFFRPVMAAATVFRKSLPILPIKIGEYRLNDFGQWHWCETPEGRAYRTLFDNQQ